MYNKPVNAQLVADQFRAAMTKPQAEKALAALAASGDAVLKENGVPCLVSCSGALRAGVGPSILCS